MPQGCTFICDNKDCECQGKSIEMIGPWPTQFIDEAIANAESEEEKNGLIQSKIEGHTTALFVFPRDSGKVPVGWRIQLLCQQEWIRFNDYEFQSKQEANDVMGSPPLCRNCNSQLKSYKVLVHEGLLCPFCNHKMTPNYWFTKTNEC